MNTLINAPETKKLNAVVLNSISVLAATDEYTERYLLDCNDLQGNIVDSIFIGKKLYDKVCTLVGKVIDIVYKDCIAGVTQWIDEDDINEEVQFHTVDHKQVVDIVKTNDINLLITCSKLGMKDMYDELKELNK